MIHQSSSISTANPLEKENEIWAICYLNSNEDTHNQCILTQNELVIYRNSNEFRVLNSELKSLSIGKSKHLFYIIAGGIIAPLSLLAIYEHLLSTSLLLVVAALAIGLFYHGLSGTEALIVKKNKLDFQIPLDKPSQGLLNFIVFVNTLIPEFKKSKIIFYAKKGTTGEFYQLLTPDNIEIAQNPNNDFLLIDFLKLDKEIEIKPTNSGYGLFISKINDDCIIKRAE